MTERTYPTPGSEPLSDCEAFGTPLSQAEIAVTRGTPDPEARDAALITRIMGSTITDGDCAVWRGGCSSKNHPSMYYQGKSQLVRRLLWTAHNKSAPANTLICMSCSTQNCVEISHMTRVTRRVMGAKLGAMGLLSGPLRSAAIARTKRLTQAKLTADQVREIKSSNESGQKIAARFGVSQSCVSKIRTNRSWRDYSSPWAQLL